ncbi:MAG: polysaccharide deacetylase family protein [Gemmatimonadetes bacterium]|nr:polysaccharide deacetylase family protein [Gemmatimonadota bacterium]
MDVLLTYDYELFFGEDAGSVERCMLEPTRRILDVLDRHGAKATFYVDAGYLVRCQGLGADERGRTEVTAQLRRLRAGGHGVELHVHPHWEDAVFEGARWVMNPARYRLADFSSEAADRIVHSYSDSLSSAVGQRPVAYRAGGWCCQPFAHFADALFRSGIRVESTVVPGARSMSRGRGYDFTGSPVAPWWRFESDPLEPVRGGRFVELPITAMKVSPSFYWRIAASRLARRSEDRAFGDGRSLTGDRDRLLRAMTRTSIVPVGLDGTKAMTLRTARRVARGRGPLVAIGHPKAQTPRSLALLDAFLAAHPQDRFVATRTWYEESIGEATSDLASRVE